MRTIVRLLVINAILFTAGCKKTTSAVAKDGGGASVQRAEVAAPADADARFWRWFEANAARLLASEDLVAVMNEIGTELEKTHPGLIAELIGGTDRRTLVISADGDKKLFPDVQRVFAARPTIAGWDVIAFRPPRDPGDGDATVEMNGTSLDPSKVRFVVVATGKTMDIDVFIPGYVKDDETMGMLGFLVLDHTVGEYAMETRIGGIGWYPIEQAPAGARPLAELPALLSAPN